MPHLSACWHDKSISGAPTITSRDPSSTHDHPEWTDPEPDYAIRIDPACQFKAVITSDSRNIRIRRILDKHDEPESHDDIDIPVFDTAAARLGRFRDSFLHRQLTGPDKDALYIIYIASDRFHKQKIPNTPVDSLPIADTTHPTTRYIKLHIIGAKSKTNISRKFPQHIMIFRRGKFLLR